MYPTSQGAAWINPFAAAVSASTGMPSYSHQGQEQFFVPFQAGQPVPPIYAQHYDSAASYTPGANITGIAATNRTAADATEATEIGRCHLHRKPQLTCKFCRKYKRAVHHEARLAQQQAQWQPQEGNKNAIAMTNTTTFNVNNLLRENILSSEYFKSLYALKTFNEVVDEIYQFADHAEPYCAGNCRAPSTLFCCLYKLMLLKLTEQQMHTLLDHVDSPYIRVAGFLYLRYVHPPDQLWKWYESYVLDDEEFSPGADKTRMTTIGEFVESLITDDKYFATVLPRLPVKIKTQYGTQLIAMDEHRKRKSQNKRNIDLFQPGEPVAACTNGDWLEGEIIEVTEPHLGRVSCIVKLEDDTQEEIDIGLIKLNSMSASSNNAAAALANEFASVGSGPAGDTKTSEGTRVSSSYSQDRRDKEKVSSRKQREGSATDDFGRDKGRDRYGDVATNSHRSSRRPYSREDYSEPRKARSSDRNVPYEDEGSSAAAANNHNNNEDRRTQPHSGRTRSRGRHSPSAHSSRKDKDKDGSDRRRYSGRSYSHQRDGESRHHRSSSRHRLRGYHRREDEIGASVDKHKQKSKKEDESSDKRRKKFDTVDVIGGSGASYYHHRRGSTRRTSLEPPHHYKGSRRSRSRSASRSGSHGRRNRVPSDRISRGGSPRSRHRGHHEDTSGGRRGQGEGSVSRTDGKDEEASERRDGKREGKGKSRHYDDGAGMREAQDDEGTIRSGGRSTKRDREDVLEDGDVIDRRKGAADDSEKIGCVDRKEGRRSVEREEKRDSAANCSAKRESCRKGRGDDELQGDITAETNGGITVDEQANKSSHGGKRSHRSLDQKYRDSVDDVEILGESDRSRRKRTSRKDRSYSPSHRDRDASPEGHGKIGRADEKKKILYVNVESGDERNKLEDGEISPRSGGGVRHSLSRARDVSVDSASAYRSSKRHRADSDVASRSGRSRSRSGTTKRNNKDTVNSHDSRIPKTQDELLQEYRRRESAKVVATGRDYARRPTSYKSCLSLKMEATSSSHRNLSSLSHSYSSSMRTPASSSRHRHTQLTSSSQRQRNPSPAKNGESAAQYGQQQAKLAHLMEKYQKEPKATNGGGQSGSYKKDSLCEGPDVLRLG